MLLEDTLFENRSLESSARARPKPAWPLKVLAVMVLVATCSAASLSATVSSQLSCESTLIKSIHDRNTAEALKIIASGADLKAACQSDKGTTALIEAIVFDEPEVVERLVLTGADVNEMTKGGEFPLLIASFHCRQEFMALLLAHGANVNAVDLNGYSALIQSTQNCTDGRSAALLLRLGARVNLRANDGNTALTTAAFYGNEDAIHVLVAAGADLKTQNGNGETAAMIAHNREVGRKESHTRIYEFLAELTEIEAARSGK